MRSEQEFRSFFRCVTDNDPYPYQVRLAFEPIQSRAISVPTGAGKTAAAIAAWLWRLKTDTNNTPRRLVYCLPMRVLVEQTRDNAKKWAKAAHANAGLPQEVHVYTLMGGEVEEEWELHPERPAILVGTQDMLLSRALNRGYAMSRYQWPVHFGLVNNDCLWVCDEVQLMGSGLGTTTQLQAWREEMGGFGPSATWWMSATMNREWLKTVDYAAKAEALIVDDLKPDDLANEDLNRKYMAPKPIEELRSLQADSVLAKHRPTTLTLVITNTVKRARELHQALCGQPAKRKAPPRPPTILIHSRFRPPDRREQVRKMLLADKRLRDEVCEALSPQEEEWLTRAVSHGVIVVSTQVVEAGVDISSETLITEVAPWVCLVQRFGRLNRYGEQQNAKAFWVDVKIKKGEAYPYDLSDLAESRTRLGAMSDVEIATLNAVELKGPARTHVLRRHDLHGLYSTEPDLAGGFTDVSPYVRDLTRDVDVLVYWRDFKGTPPTEDPQPDAEELCHVPCHEMEEFLGNQSWAWEWDAEEDSWSARRGRDIRPGMTLLLETAGGGYRSDVGWTGEKSDIPSRVLPGSNPPDSMNRDNGSETDWYPLAPHLLDTEAEAKRLVKDLGLANSPEGDAVVLGALWHDVGKVHAKWQMAAVSGLQPPRPAPWAKFPYVEKRQFRPGLRHEMASALRAWQLWQRGEKAWTALVVYLIACHHGKVRTVLRARLRFGEDAFGVGPNDVLPPLEGWLPDEVKMELRCKTFGVIGEWDDTMTSLTVSEPSWVGMVAELLGPEFPDDPAPVDAILEGEPRTLGPFRLSFLECLITTADKWASRRPGRLREQ